MKRNMKMAGPEAGREARYPSALAERGRRERGENRLSAVIGWEEPSGVDVLASAADDESDEPEAAPARAEPAQETEDSHAADDALGLYLRQMGAIPLLTRQQELALAQRLEHMRTRYRRAALANWRTVARVVDTFERVLAGQLALDPTIDVVTTLKLSREQILARMPHNLRTLRSLLKEADANFKAQQRAASASARQRLRPTQWRRLMQAHRPAE